MDMNTILSDVGALGDAARNFVQAGATFLKELSKSGADLNLVDLDNSSNVAPIDYSGSSLDAYAKTYRPISASDIVQANKAMSEAISGEKWLEGFITCVQLMMLFKP